MCYQCDPSGEDQDYSADQCEKDQKKDNCAGGNNTCYKFHIELTDGIVQEMRGCTSKSKCNDAKETCSDKEKMKENKIKECQVACCVSTGDTPCNSASIASSSVMFMMMVAALGSLKLF